MMKIAACLLLGLLVWCGAPPSAGAAFLALNTVQEKQDLQQWHPREDGVVSLSGPWPLADNMGLPKDILYTILSTSFAQSRIYDRHYTQFVEKEQFQPGFAINLLHKDLVLVNKMAAENGAALPLGTRVEELINTAKVKGFGEKDMSGMYMYMKESNEQR